MAGRRKEERSHLLESDFATYNEKRAKWPFTVATAFSYLGRRSIRFITAPSSFFFSIGATTSGEKENYFLYPPPRFPRFLLTKEEKVGGPHFFHCRLL